MDGSTIELGGREYRMRWTMQATEGLHERSGINVLAPDEADKDRFEEYASTPRGVIDLVHLALLDNEDAPGRDEVARMMTHGDLKNVLGEVADVVREALGDLMDEEAGEEGNPTEPTTPSTGTSSKPSPATTSA